MVKRVVSSVLQKKKPIHRSNKRRRLRSIFRKFCNYMKSDTYMFSPVIHPQSSATFSPASLVEGFGEPIKRKEKKLVQGLEEYLKRDCYMYAPMVLDSAVETPNAPPTGVWFQRNKNPVVHSDLIGRSSEKMMRGSGNRVDSFRGIEHDDVCYTPSEQIAVKHAIARNEAVKHVVQQNCHPKSIRGKGLFQSGTRKIAVE